MASDRQAKAIATRDEKKRVFEHMNAPEDIYANCSDGWWVKRVWRNPNGVFGWNKWIKA